MENPGQIAGHKISLSSGRIVLIRDQKIKHQRLAIAAASKKAAGDQTMLGVYASEELVKMLVVEIDGKPVKPIDLEDLDSIFTLAEYGQVLKVLGKLNGDSPDMGECQIEIVSSGGN